MQHYARIERTGSRSHAEAIQSGEAECAIDAFPCSHGAHACATSEVSNDDAAACNLGSDLRQDGSDVFIGQAVKAVSLHAGFANFARQRNELGYRRLSTMEAG